MTLRFRHSVLFLSLVAFSILISYMATAHVRAQAPKPATAAPKPAAPVARPAGATQATMAQVMKGVLFPNSNVVFAAQSDDPDKVPKEKDPATATNPLASTYGGWEAVQNSSLALTESARLLEVPRACSNGKPAPIQSATWKKGLTELRAAGLAAYKAAQAKNQDGILDAADKITTACSTCHEKYREQKTRCVE